MTNEKFKNALIEFNKASRNLENEKLTFEADITVFMKERGIPVRVEFFIDTFGLDIDYRGPNWDKIPRKIPLDVLVDFCKEFGCEYEYTNCDGSRYIFKFDKLKVRFW